MSGERTEAGSPWAFVSCRRSFGYDARGQRKLERAFTTDAVLLKCLQAELVGFHMVG